ncbi:putative carbohydrate-active enzyme [Anopheles sinensis]|uniref:Putative carbohydrate-active enzyme n=1 Tax=Anopheles sinensis TaxID=74873 RepID=A0A084WRZ1_ANOSI|nr:putative carbohydrate-active enzyme [Anopheles sinensis]
MNARETLLAGSELLATESPQNQHHRASRLEGPKRCHLQQLFHPDDNDANDNTSDSCGWRGGGGGSGM